MSSPSILISVVVPVYRSENCIEPLYDAIYAALSATGASFELILVNDCSPDGSWDKISGLCSKYPEIIGINLRKNFGQDAAILAGLRYASGRYIAVMDDDLQHDPAELPRLLAVIEETKCDVVYANFERKYQAWWKNLGSWFNGKVAELAIQKPSSVYLSPYKILSAGVVKQVLNYAGPYPYLDGILFQITSRITQIDAKHRSRHAGSSNYNLIRSIKVWSRLMFGFSAFPLRLMGMLGLSITLLTVLLISSWDNRHNLVVFWN